MAVSSQERSELNCCLMMSARVKNDIKLFEDRNVLDPCGLQVEEAPREIFVDGFDVSPETRALQRIQFENCSIL